MQQSLASHEALRFLFCECLLQAHVCNQTLVAKLFRRARMHLVERVCTRGSCCVLVCSNRRKIAEVGHSSDCVALVRQSHRLHAAVPCAVNGAWERPQQAVSLLLVGLMCTVASCRRSAVKESYLSAGKFSRPISSAKRASRCHSGIVTTALVSACLYSA